MKSMAWCQILFNSSVRVIQLLESQLHGIERMEYLQFALYNSFTHLQISIRGRSYSPCFMPTCVILLLHVGLPTCVYGYLSTCLLPTYEPAFRRDSIFTYSPTPYPRQKLLTFLHVYILNFLPPYLPACLLRCLPEYMPVRTQVPLLIYPHVYRPMFPSLYQPTCLSPTSLLTSMFQPAYPPSRIHLPAHCSAPQSHAHIIILWDT